MAIVAPSESSRAAAAQTHPQARVFPDHRRMLAETEIDIVDIVTPSDTHLEIATDVINAGRHLLLEKPMAVRIVDCQTMIRLARERGVKFAIGYEFRFSSQWGEIKRRIDAGVVGEPQYVLVELSRKSYRLGSAGWRYDPARVGSWALEEPVHFFDLARWYLTGAGNPVELVAYANSRDGNRPALHDNFSAMFRYANGAYAVISQTLAAFEHHQTVKVAGTKGAIWAGWSGAMDRTLHPECFLKVFDGDKVENVTLAGQSGEIFELHTQIAHCIDMVRGRVEPAATGEDGLWSAGLCLLAEESIRQKRPLPVNHLPC